MYTLTLLLALIQAPPIVIRGMEQEILDSLRTRMTLTATGEGTSICKIAPDGIKFDFSITSVGGYYRRFGYVKNSGLAPCMVDEVLINPAGGEELDTNIPALVLPGEYATITLSYQPTNHGIDTWDIEISWATARYLNVPETVVGGRVSALINGIWTRNGPVGYILVPEAAVTLTAIPNTGYQFVRWENPADGTTLATPVNTFPMPNDDITLTPIFEEIP